MADQFACYCIQCNCFVGRTSSGRRGYCTQTSQSEWVRAAAAAAVATVPAPTMGSTTNEMMAFLQQLKARVAQLEEGQQQASNAVSDSDDENEGLMSHSQG